MSHRRLGTLVALGVTLGVPLAPLDAQRTALAPTGQARASVARAPSRVGLPVKLIGLWEAYRHFGPDVRGRLVVDSAEGGWRAAIAGRVADARVTADSIAFVLPDSSASFRARFDRGRQRITGQWIQRRDASPLTLTPCGARCYAADVVPLDNEATIYLKVTQRPDGSLGAFLRNPERNLGWFLHVDHVEGDSTELRFLDRSGAVKLRGVMRDDVVTVYIDGRGGSYDFRRVPDAAFTWFYPRGRPTAPYRYVPPRAQDDGWTVGRLQDVGMSEPKIAAFIQSLIDAPIDSLGVLYPHGLLVARHGKLVLEEYFHGEHNEKPHDTRSAAKSVLSVMIGAAALEGIDISPQTRVYDVMRPDAKNLDPRKKALTVQNLLDMASGLDCDDNGEERPGNEDNVTQGDDPDWYRLILDLKMIRNPGDTAVYCSINPHLAGGVLARRAGRTLPELMWELIGEPMQMRDYHMWLSPRGDGYMGGGMRFRPRDFMKLGQLYLDGGTWHGKRIVSAEWVKATTAPHYRMSPLLQYGSLWWMIEYPYQGKRVQAFFASGNGGNEVMAIPALDLVIAVYGANYNESAGWAMVKELVPRYILPALER